MHGQSTVRPTWTDPKAERIALLSEEYLNANAARRDEIGNEISGLISGQILPLVPKQ
jgi:hypothetical protein